MCTNQAFQRYSITRRTMSIANIVALKSLVLLLTISCGNQKTSNDSASAILSSSTDSRNLCENLRDEGIEVSSCDSLKASSAQAPTRYLADVVNTMSQLKLDKAATIRQPIILESMSGAKSPTIRISAVTDRSTFRGLVILSYGSNSNEISPSSNVQAMVAGNLAKDLQASTVLILTVIESEADQQIIFNGSSRIDPNNLQLLHNLLKYPNTDLLRSNNDFISCFGTISINGGTDVVIGRNTIFLTQLSVGDYLYSNDGTVLYGIVSSINSNTYLVLQSQYK